MVPRRIDYILEMEGSAIAPSGTRKGTHLEQVKFQAWFVKQKTDETAPSASVNMVLILPMEFKAAVM